jgi:hypothetical protein
MPAQGSGSLEIVHGPIRVAESWLLMEVATILSLLGASGPRASLSSTASSMASVTAALLVAGSFRHWSIGLGWAWATGVWHLGTCCGGFTLAVQGVLGFFAHRTDSLGDWSLGFLGGGWAIGSLV